MPDELCTEVRDIVQDRNQDHPQEKQMEKAKWLAEEALQIAVKKRDTKGKGEKERYKLLNAEWERLEIFSRK